MTPDETAVASFPHLVVIASAMGKGHEWGAIAPLVAKRTDFFHAVRPAQHIPCLLQDFLGRYAGHDRRQQQRIRPRSKHPDAPPSRRISSRAWEHPADRGALVALRQLKGFDVVLRRLASLWNERTLRLVYIGSAIRVDDRQFRRVHLASPTSSPRWTCATYRRSSCSPIHDRRRLRSVSTGRSSSSRAGCSTSWTMRSSASSSATSWATSSRGTLSTPRCCCS